MNSNLAPIVLFVYNRPAHTLQTLESLYSCQLANQSKLYIYCDGAAVNSSSELVEKVKNTREILKQKKWCAEVEIIERGSNYGLAKSVISGVTEIIHKHGKVIVLEDDLVLSAGFLKYMNESLNLYQDSEEVMHVSGYMFPVDSTSLPETFFYKSTTCWGWSTWKRAWDKFEPDAKKLVLNEKINRDKYKYDIDGSYENLDMLKRQVSGQIDSWAILWYSSLFINDGLALHPKKSLVENIGHDGSGVHSDYSTRFSVERKADFIEVTKQKIQEHIPARKLVKDFFTQKNKVKKIINKLLHPRIIRILKTTLLKSNRDEYMEIKRLSKIDRYIGGGTNLFAKEFLYTDAASFLFMYQEIFKRKIYLFDSPTETPYIIDCGANIGLSVLFFKNVFPNAEIVAFEPDKNTYHTLSENIKAFGLTNVIPVNKAVWNENTLLSFESDGADGGKVTSSENAYKVEAVMLEPYLNKDVDLLKIDIEGAEVVVLENIQKHLPKVKRMFIEFHSFNKQPQELNKLLAILSESQFRYYIEHVGVRSNNPFVKRSIYANMDNQLNIFACRI